MSVTEIAGEVGAGRRSAVDVAREALDRVAAYEAVQPAVWITHIAEAMCWRGARGRCADRGAASGCRWPACPFAVKDNIDVAGLPTTAACPAIRLCADAARRWSQRLMPPARC